MQLTHMHMYSALTLVSLFGYEYHHVLHVGPHHVSFCYSIGNDVIPQVTQCKDLGVVLTGSLCPAEHM